MKIYCHWCEEGYAEYNGDELCSQKNCSHYIFEVKASRKNSYSCWYGSNTIHVKLSVTSLESTCMIWRRTRTYKGVICNGECPVLLKSITY
jgi:hypothetical protein